MQRSWGLGQGASKHYLSRLRLHIEARGLTLRDTGVVRIAAFHYSFMAEAAMLGGMCSLHIGSRVTKRTRLQIRQGTKSLGWVVASWGRSKVRQITI